MIKINHKVTKVSNKIWQWVRDNLEEISDEVGVDKNGKYLLAYEGWGGFCVSKVYDSKKSDEENEDAYYEFAKEQSSEVIDEWVGIYRNRYSLIDCGHEPTGLYGVTWALFKKYSRESGTLILAQGEV